MNSQSSNPIIDAIIHRKSIRSFRSDPVPKEVILKILECGRWTPSGLNHQPWHIYIVQDHSTKEALAKCTTYSHIVRNAPCILVIYLDQTKDYSYVKNVQSIGALFENLLLGIHALGLGGVWLGQIYNNKEMVNKIFNISDPSLEFMGVIAFGYPAETGSSERKNLEQIVTFWDK
jgi:nitroreductase